MPERMVFILDDNDEFRESTAWVLEGMDYAVEHYSDPLQLIETLGKIRKFQLGCLLLDIRMPIMSGLDVHDLLNDKGIDIPVIYMTAHGDVPLAVSAMSKGALTFLEKPLDDKLLDKTLKQAFSAGVQRRRSTRVAKEEIQKTKQRLETLTPRELQVVQGVVSDRSNKQIADDFHISIKTVELHRSRVMNKLSAKNAAHLVRMVMSCDAV
ncbi:MAG: response regulator [Granulosicoccus sp.]